MNKIQRIVVVLVLLCLAGVGVSIGAERTTAAMYDGLGFAAACVCVGGAAYLLAGCNWGRG